MKVDIDTKDKTEFYDFKHTTNEKPNILHSMHAHDNDLEVEWNTGICGCISSDTPSVCCMACVCPCLLFGEIHHALQRTDFTGYKENSTARCNAAACEFCSLDYHVSAIIFVSFGYFTGCWIPIPSFSCLTHNVTRRQIRHRNQLRGSCFSDVLLTFFCTCCVLVQEYSQIFPDST